MRISAFSVAVVALVLAGCGDDKAAAPGAAGDATAGATSGAAVVPPPAGSNWTEVTAMTPEGGFRMGNPDAKVKLVEFASLTCPHCKDFHEAASETIKNRYVASGEVSYEFRNFVLNGPDYAASLLARCQGPQAFFGLLGAFFNDQANWLEPFTKLTPEQQAALSALPQEQQMAGLAAAGELDGYVRTRGIPKAKFDQCLADEAAIKTLADLRTQATDKYKLTGTPGFVINEQTQEGVFDWKTLEPKLQAALQ
ncbi:protein-disulfide isomerase [Polymorphobacter multimanifer]|uniref:Protein-disulfide isomerase n=2 Tax=Polymorphobacter multimanifer TaxID=1070431 RepID=A0A841LEY1_9SPHN|nr:thioredoxin domain-containing protein [Polymorphobacter multimanifer]MBB6227712.1 protein-disulfide isomerase [Polymorphobacter multimanifer]